MEKIYQKIVHYLPSKLIYFTVIEAWARATTGEYGHRNATSVTVKEILESIYAPKEH